MLVWLFAETIDAAMKFVRDELGVRPTYLSPGGEAVEIPEIPGFRFYVLGPPRGEASLGDLGAWKFAFVWTSRGGGVAVSAACGE